MAKFKLGETVQLRSGDPEMTIIDIIEGQNPSQWAMYVRRWKAENPLLMCGIKRNGLKTQI